MDGQLTPYAVSVKEKILYTVSGKKWRHFIFDYTFLGRFL